MPNLIHAIIVGVKCGKIMAYEIFGVEFGISALEYDRNYLVLHFQFVLTMVNGFALV